MPQAFANDADSGFEPAAMRPPERAVDKTKGILDFAYLADKRYVVRLGDLSPDRCRRNSSYQFSIMRMAGSCDQSARSEEDGDSGLISSDERQNQRPQIRRPPGYAPNPSSQMSHLAHRDGYYVRCVQASRLTCHLSRIIGDQS